MITKFRPHWCFYSFFDLMVLISVQDMIHVVHNIIYKTHFYCPELMVLAFGPTHPPFYWHNIRMVSELDVIVAMSPKNWWWCCFQNSQRKRAMPERGDERRHYSTPVSTEKNTLYVFQGSSCLLGSLQKIHEHLYFWTRRFESVLFKFP